MTSYHITHHVLDRLAERIPELAGIFPAADAEQFRASAEHLAFLTDRRKHPVQFPHEGDGQIEQRVADLIALGGPHLHGLHGGWIAVDADGQIKVFVGHELMQALHGAGRSRFQFHGHHALLVLDEMIDLARTAAVALPVV